MVLHGFLPYLLPLLRPFLLLIFLLTVGPCVFNKITQLIHQRLETIKLHQAEVHYHKMTTQESSPSYDWLFSYEHPFPALHLTSEESKISDRLG